MHLECYEGREEYVSLREKYKVPADAVVVLLIASCRPVKDVAFLVPSLAKLLS